MQKYDKTEWVKNSIVASSANMDKIEKQLEILTNNSIEINEQLDTIGNNIDNYKHLVATNDNIENWSIAIQKALNDKGSVTLNNRTYTISSPIILSSYDTIIGKDKNKSIIKLNDNSNCPMITLKDSSTVTSVTLNSFTLDGNRKNQTSVNSALHIVNDFNIEFDPMHSIHNIIIKEVNGSGFTFHGRSGSSISNIDVQRVNVHGFDINCYDTTFTSCSAGHAKDGIALLVNGANNRLLDCKGWGSLEGIYLKGSRCVCNVIESQDNGKYGIKIDGGMNIITNALCDSIGYRYRAGQGIFETDATSIIVNGYDNTIEGVCVDRAEFSITGSQCYAVECIGGRNKITLIAKDLITNAIKDKPNKSNKIEFISALNKENTGNVTNRFVNEINGIVNGNGYTISGDNNLSVLLPVINNEKQFTKEFEYNHKKDSYQIGTHFIPKGWSLDLGASTNKWRSIWIREYLNIKNDENTADLVLGENVILNKKAPLYIRGGMSTTGIVIDSDTNTIKGHSNAKWNLGTTDNRFLNLYLVNSPSVSSKRELKENIKLFDDEQAYDNIKQLNIYTYNYKKFDEKGNYIGIDAENMLGCLLDELPIECINEQAEGVDLYAYTSYCISALKKAIEKIEILENKIKELSNV